MLYEALHEESADGLMDSEGSRFELSSRLKHLPGLPEQEEEALWVALERCSAHILVTCVESPAGLEALKKLLADIEADNERFDRALPGESPERLNLLGLIDELETLYFLDRDAVPLRRRSKLKAHLMRWSPPHHLVIPVMAEAIQHWGNDSVAARVRRHIDTWYGHRNRLVQANLGLVHSIAARFRYLGLSYQDLVQEGCLGLIKAIERFDWRKGFRFSTYAFRVISQSVHLALDQQTALVRKPFRMLRDKALVNETRNRLEQTLGRSPLAAELRAALPSDMPFMPLHLEGNTRPSADSQSLYAQSPEVADHPDVDQPEVCIQADKINTRLLALLPEVLDRRQDIIIRMRFGIGLGSEHTYEEIGSALSLSAERVRQLTRAALLRLQEHASGL